MKKINNYTGKKIAQYGNKIQHIITDDVNHKLTIWETIRCSWYVVCAIPFIVLLFVTDRFI